ncbi:glycosyltransferase [Metabacillus sp. GX 13764]|uniref:glycosyltransferase family 4 protein n=1 Tax=Metabacillus kandeliae TaxID=2900151 RepID=UPI001E339EEC|nr:glycosyltransferase [Metabacillus kandeliae]MCD7034499.1 glycosyltransferase [Metabacillus kandeliae]
MKHIIVYFPYELQKNPKSGSGVRPKKLTEAFRRYGEKHQVEVVVISGQSRERKQKINEYLHQYSINEALFCYMENSTMPFWLTDHDHVPRAIGMDAGFWKKLKAAHVPIGCFYRDVYWQFNDMYVPPFGKQFLTPVMQSIYRKELKAYHKSVDILYLPSLEMNRFVKWTKEYDELPPGMEKVDHLNRSDKSISSAVYVGGITDQLGILTMLKAFDGINADGVKVELNFICREGEFKKDAEIQGYQDKPWINILHLSGDELKEVYEKSDIALIPREKNTYHDFAMPVKLFEYLAHQLPIVATNCDAQARLLEDNNFGIVSKVDKDDFKDAVLRALQPEVHAVMISSIRQHAFEKNSWDARVEKVVNDLTSLNRQEVKQS